MEGAECNRASAGVFHSQPPAHGGSFYDGAKAELALDDCEILVVGRRVCMKEIELELKQGSAEKWNVWRGK